MSEKVFLAITAVFMSISAIGPTFFNLSFIPSFICSLIPVACLPLLLMGKKGE